MKTTLSMSQIEEQSYSVGDEVMIAYNQAADVRGYNRTGVITKVIRDGYEVRDNRNESYRVGCEDIAPLSSKAE